jgi:membrane-bound lytic murein transglycosylase
MIPTLPQPWNAITFNADDVGPDIKGKHIDVYTGEGFQAGKETFRITGLHNQVCLA